MKMPLSTRCSVDSAACSVDSAATASRAQGAHRAHSGCSPPSQRNGASASPASPPPSSARRAVSTRPGPLPPLGSTNPKPRFEPSPPARRCSSRQHAAQASSRTFGGAGAHDTRAPPAAPPARLATASRATAPNSPEASASPLACVPHTPAKAGCLEFTSETLWSRLYTRCAQVWLTTQHERAACGPQVRRGDRCMHLTTHNASWQHAIARSQAWFRTRSLPCSILSSTKCCPSWRHNSAHPRRAQWHPLSPRQSLELLLRRRFFRYKRCRTPTSLCNGRYGGRPCACGAGCRRWCGCACGRERLLRSERSRSRRRLSEP